MTITFQAIPIKNKNIIWLFIVLALSLTDTRCVVHDTDLPWNSNISKTVRVDIAIIKKKIFKEYLIRFLIVSRFIDLALVVL